MKRAPPPPNNFVEAAILKAISGHRVHKAQPIHTSSGWLLFRCQSTKEPLILTSKFRGGDISSMIFGVSGFNSYLHFEPKKSD